MQKSGFRIFLFKNPKKSDPKIRIQGHDSLKIRLCTVCVHKYYIPANGAEIGFSDFFDVFSNEILLQDFVFEGVVQKRIFADFPHPRKKKSQHFFRCEKPQVIFLHDFDALRIFFGLSQIFAELRRVLSLHMTAHCTAIPPVRFS